MSELFRVSSAPHVRAKTSTQNVMMWVCIAMLPTACFGIYNFGVRALLLIVATVLSCVVSETVYNNPTFIKINNLLESFKSENDMLVYEYENGLHETVKFMLEEGKISLVKGNVTESFDNVVKFNEHVNIISKEAITTMPTWPIALATVIVIMILIGALIDLFISKNADRVTKITITAGGFGILAVLVVGIISGIFFQVPTGRYKYEAIIDKENITIEEYEEFIHSYNHTKYENGVYYFEDFE